MADLSDTIRAKTDQLNADDFKVFPAHALLGQIKRVIKTGGDQPVSVWLSSWDQPWKPCKTMRRVMFELWGKESDDYIGRSVRLTRDPEVGFGTQLRIGGVRISHMSDVPKEIGNVVIVKTSKGQTRPYRVDAVTGEMFKAMNLTPDPLLPLRAACNAALRRSWTKAQIIAVLGCDKPEQTAEADRSAMIEKLNTDPEKAEGGEE